MDYWDIEEIADAVLSLPDEIDENRDYDELIYDRFGITMEQFGEIVTALIPFTIPAKDALTGNTFQGFVKDGAFIVKKPYDS